MALQHGRPLEVDLHGLVTVVQSLLQCFTWRGCLSSDYSHYSLYENFPTRLPTLLRLTCLSFTSNRVMFLVLDYCRSEHAPNIPFDFVKLPSRRNAETHRLLQPWDLSFQPTLHTKIIRIDAGQTLAIGNSAIHRNPRWQPDSVRDLTVIGMAAIPSLCLDPPAIPAPKTRLPETQRGEVSPPPALNLMHEKTTIRRIGSILLLAVLL